MFWQWWPWIQESRIGRMRSNSVRFYRSIQEFKNRGIQGSGNPGIGGSRNPGVQDWSKWIRFDRPRSEDPGIQKPWIRESMNPGIEGSMNPGLVGFYPFRLKAIEGSRNSGIQGSRIGRMGFYCNRCKQIGFIDCPIRSNSIRSDRTRSNLIIQLCSIEMVSIAIDSSGTVLSISRPRPNSIRVDRIRSNSIIHFDPIELVSIATSSIKSVLSIVRTRSKLIIQFDSIELVSVAIVSIWTVLSMGWMRSNSEWFRSNSIRFKRPKNAEGFQN